MAQAFLMNQKYTITTGIEYKRVPYQKSTTILFENAYLSPPAVVAGLCYDFFEPGEHTFPIYNIAPTIEYITQNVSSTLFYVGVKIIWGGDIDSIDNAYTTMIAICS